MRLVRFRYSSGQTGGMKTSLNEDEYIKIKETFIQGLFFCFVYSDIKKARRHVQHSNRQRNMHARNRHGISRGAFLCNP